MKTPGVRAVMLSAALWVLAPVATGDEGKTYDLGRKDAWQAGDVVTLTFKESEATKRKVLAADGTLEKEVPTASTTTATLVEKCLEADADGHRTKAVVYVQSWLRDDGAARDESIKGALLDVTGRGRGGAWAVHAAGGDAVKPSPAAKKWLDRRYGADSTDEEGWMLAVMPKAPVAVGATWDVDSAPAGPTSPATDPAVPDPAATPAPPPAPPATDKPKGTVKGTLSAVEFGAARIAIEKTLPSATVPGTSPDLHLTWAKGGVRTAKGELTLALEGRLRLGVVAMKGALEGEFKIPSGSTISLSMAFSTDERHALGGEVPDLKEAPADGGSPPK